MWLPRRPSGRGGFLENERSKTIPADEICSNGRKKLLFAFEIHLFFLLFGKGFRFNLRPSLDLEGENLSISGTFLPHNPNRSCLVKRLRAYRHFTLSRQPKRMTSFATKRLAPTWRCSRFANPIEPSINSFQPLRLVYRLCPPILRLFLTSTITIQTLLVIPTLSIL